VPNPDLRRVLFAHTVLIERCGGSEGVRDLESLKAAIERPWGSSFEREHFPGPYLKAAPLRGRQQEDRCDDGFLPIIHSKLQKYVRSRSAPY
jgi:hypothetical protein